MILNLEWVLKTACQSPASTDVQVLSQLQTNGAFCTHQTAILYHHLPADHRVLRCRDGATACPKPKCCQKWSSCRVNQISFQYNVWWWQKWLVLDYTQDAWESIKYLMTIIKHSWHVPITQYSSNPAHEMIHSKTCDTIPIHPSPPWGADDTYPSHNTHPPKSTMRC